MKKIIRTLKSRTQSSRLIFRSAPILTRGYATLPDLPSELLLQILSYCITPTPLSRQPFWLLDITPHVLLSPYNNTTEPNEQRLEQVQMAKSLSLVCRRTWSVFVPFVWSCFCCSNPVAFTDLMNACASERDLGSYIQHLDLRLQFLERLLPTDTLCFQLAAVWPKLTSLRSLTLALTPNYPCPYWLAEELRDIPTLQSLHLIIRGSRLGTQLRALPLLEALFVEVQPPVIKPNSNTAYPDLTGLFNNAVEMFDACVEAGNVKHLGLFVHGKLTSSFYQHFGKSTRPPNLSAPIQIPDPGHNVAPILSIKQLIPSNLSSLSRLSLTLESHRGTEAFLRAAGGLPITDLALRSYDWSLLSGTVFRDFCATFSKLRRLRLKLWRAINGVGEPVANGFIDQDAFVQGLTSLKCLEAFKGPVLLRGRTIGGLLDGAAQKSLHEVVSALKGSGTLSPDLMLHWHLLFDEGNGPRQAHWVPDEPVRLGDWKTAYTLV
ncbi:hypothetical protein BDV93DRAFT_519128 [Ceratobasidium sp. AG-I]|nr:hypothetical protein BDV93DRAFT_519128 [Ceratobasidium sp. AG-I]